jgi:hypothetical protein
MDWSKLPQYAGPLALAAFAGTLMGGLALSLFWKYFGPWKMLDECKIQLSHCHSEREEDSRDRAKLAAQLAEMNTAYGILKQALAAGGLGLVIGHPTEPSIKLDTMR